MRYQVGLVLYSTQNLQGRIVRTIELKPERRAFNDKTLNQRIVLRMHTTTLVLRV